MSACRRQAVSQVGCRLMVASKAKISRPRCPASVAGARLFTLVRKASISERVECGAGARAPSAGAGVLLLRSLDITADHVRERLFALKVDIPGISYQWSVIGKTPYDWLRLLITDYRPLSTTSCIWSGAPE